MKNLFRMLLLASAVVMSVTGCSSDDEAGNGPDSPDGSAGKVEMLYGKWHSTHLWAERKGTVTNKDIKPSFSLLTFNSNGYFSESADGTLINGHWSYDISTRKLIRENSASRLEEYVKTLTESTLIVSGTEYFDGVALNYVLTYAKTSANAQMQAESSCESVDTPLPMHTALRNFMDAQK